jgi:sensitive to high expression protein 9, mitochondrial
VLIFLVFQFGFEPWRRRRLVRGFEEKVHEALKREKERQAAVGRGERGGEGGSGLDEVKLDRVVAAGVQELELEMEMEMKGAKDQKPACDALAALISDYASEAGGETRTTIGKPRGNGLGYLGKPDTWKAGVLDLFSDRIVSLRQRDITIVALEGTATGAALVGLIMFMLRLN